MAHRPRVASATNSVGVRARLLGWMLLFWSCSTGAAEPIASPAQDRAARRQAHVLALRAQFRPEVLRQTTVRDELRTHAWRMARLERLMALGRETKNEGGLARVQRIISVEVAMHRRRMEFYRARFTSPAASGAP
jgi:hypothetical protein